MRLLLPARAAEGAWSWGRLWGWMRGFSIFEKVVIANSIIIVLDTVAGWWITQQHAEAYHYLIDTSFIALAALAGLAINFALLRAAFAPLYSVLSTIRAVGAGDLDARVAEAKHDADADALARAFNAMLDELARARDEAAERVLRGQEEERRRLALELHDQTGQSLTALTLHAQVIAQRLEGQPGEAVAQARQTAHKLIQLAGRTLEEVQALARQLRPALLDDVGLVAALRWLAASAGEQLGVSVRMRVRGPMDDAAHGDGALRAADEVETALFRIAQECVTNAVRHGRATRVRIGLHSTGCRLVMTVADDGRGFTVSRHGHARTAPVRSGASGRPLDHVDGLGLEGMRERARLLGGACTVRSRPNGGCVVRVVIPFTVPAADVAIAASGRGQIA